MNLVNGRLSRRTVLSSPLVQKGIAGEADDRSRGRVVTQREMPVLDTFPSLLPPGAFRWSGMWLVGLCAASGSLSRRQMRSVALLPQPSFQLWSWDVHRVEGLRQSLGRGDKK